MDLLKEMFPQHDEGVIRAVLEQVGGDIEEASAVLLSPGFQPSQAPNPALPAPVHPERAPPEKRRRFEDDWTRSPRRSIGERLEKWWQDGKRTDVALICNDSVVIPAHKLVLAARSQILGVMLMTMASGEPGSAENGIFFEINPKVPLTLESIPPDMSRLDMDMNSDLCRKILKYLYTDVLEEVSVEEAPSLHEAALSLDLEFIKRKCEGADKLPHSSYGADFLALLYDPEHASSDMELVSEEGGEVFYVHKLLMGCVSDYFAEMMGGRYIEGFERRIVMKGVSEAELKLMVESVYADGRVRKDSVDEKNAFQVFLKSNQFLFRSLQELSEGVMSRFLDEDNVLVLLGDEIVRTSPSMKRNCLEFISRKYEAMQHLDGYKALPMLLQLEVEHYAAKRNEEMFTTLIATMSDGINISDFNSLVQDEISDFLESQLSHISIQDIQDNLKFQCAEKCAEKISISETSSHHIPSNAIRLLHPPKGQNIRYKLSDIKLAPPPTKNLNLFDDASRLISTVESAAFGPSSSSSSSSSTHHSDRFLDQSAQTGQTFQTGITASSSDTLDHPPLERRRRRKRGGLGAFGRIEARRKGAADNLKRILDRRLPPGPGPAIPAHRFGDIENFQVNLGIGGIGGVGRDRDRLQNAYVPNLVRRDRVASSESISSDTSSSSEEEAPGMRIQDAFIGFEEIQENPFQRLVILDPAALIPNNDGIGGAEGQNDPNIQGYNGHAIEISDEDEDDASSIDLDDTTEDEDTETETITSTDMDTDLEDDEDEMDDTDESSFSEYDSDLSETSSSGSSSSSSSSSLECQFFSKDSVSAVFSPTKLSILATDISLLIDSAKFRFESSPEREDYQMPIEDQKPNIFVDPFNSDPEPINPDRFSYAPSHLGEGYVSVHEEGEEAGPLPPNAEGSIDLGKTNILLSGVSFALSFSFSFQNNKLLGQVSKALESAGRKAAGRPMFDLGDSDDSLSSSSSESDLNALLESGLAAGDEGSSEVPLLTLHNFSCDVDQLRMQFLPHHRELKHLLEPKVPHTSGASGAGAQAEPKLTVFSRPTKYGALGAVPLVSDVPLAPEVHAKPLNAMDQGQGNRTTETAVQVPLPSRPHPLLWFPHYSAAFKQSLKGALVAAIQTQMADSLARLTEHLNRMSLRQLSSLTSSAGRKPNTKPNRRQFF